MGNKKDTSFEIDRVIQTYKKDDVRNPDEYFGIVDHMKQTSSGLLIPEQKICGFCGAELLKQNIKERYFGEEFHAKCVFEMLKGRHNG